MHAPGAVFRRHGLLDTRLPVDLQPAEAGQQITDFAMDEVTAVELRRDVDGQSQTPPGGLYAARVRYGTNEIAPQTHKSPDGPGQYTFARAHRGEAFLPRWLETVQLLQL